MIEPGPDNLVLVHRESLDKLLAPPLLSWCHRSGAIIVDNGALCNENVVMAIKREGPALFIKDSGLSEAIECFDGCYFDQADHRAQSWSKGRKSAKMFGIGGINDRHAGLEAGELNPDFVLHGEPLLDGSLVPLDRKRDFMTWWQEIIVVPLVTFAASPAESETLLAHGAEWVALDTGGLL